MARKLYWIANGAAPTTSSQVVMATTTSLNTLMQLATPSTTPATLVEWGISFDNTTANTPGKIEFIQTDVAATAGTSLTPSKWGDPNAVASLCVGGTGATMFNDGAITEGTITATRMTDLLLAPPTQPYFKQWPLGREFEVAISAFERVRVLLGTAVNAYCYAIWEE